MTYDEHGHLNMLAYIQTQQKCIHSFIKQITRVIKDNQIKILNWMSILTFLSCKLMYSLLS